MESNKAEIIITKNEKSNYLKILSGQKKHSRSKVLLKEDAKTIKIEIEADSMPVLRATINAFIREIQTVEKTLSAVKNKGR